MACGELHYASPNPKKPFVFPDQQGALSPSPTPPAPASGLPGSVPASVAGGGVGLIRVGDAITVTFSDLPANVIIPEARMRIAEDGNITLHLNMTVRAAGKTARALEQEIRSLYVPQYYNYMTVTVKTEERFYYVGGEVRNPNRQLYIGQITVLRAIDTAGGFTDFANRSKIELTRQSGEKIRVNYKKAVKDPKLDPEVFPNDQIIVPRRFW